jgi:fructose-1,6-bisphosphatase II
LAVIQDTAVSQKNLGMELVRVTEAAALASGRLMGRGDQEEVRRSAAEAMGHALRGVNMDADIVVVVGTPQPGEDLVSGLRCGYGAGPRVDLAAGPLDGVSLVARGLTGAMAVLAATEHGQMQLPGSLLLEKIAVGPRAAGAIDITESVENNLNRVAFAKQVRVSDLTVVMLDRPRHQQLLEEAREAGARVTLISDGEVSAAIRVAMEGSGVDVVMGIGGAEDATIAACALKCLAGELVARPWLRTPDDAADLETAGVDPHRVLTIADLAGGDESVFAATGVTDGLLLRGVHYHDGWAESQSLVMRSASGTVRKIETKHHYALALLEARDRVR